MCVHRIKSTIFGLVFAVFGLVPLLLFGQETVLQCSHLEPSLIVCDTETKLFDQLSLGTKTINDVRGARVDESCDEDGCTYRVVLATGQGSVPLTGYYSSGRQAKKETADQINAYVSGRGDGTIEARAGSALLAGLSCGLFVLIGLVIAVRGGVRGAA